MKSRNKFSTFFGLVALVMLVACGKSDSELDKTTRQLIETLARAELLANDSIYKIQCDSIYAYWLEVAKDSIYQTRESEIQFIKTYDTQK
ncbi:MAG: hypothetical protein IPI60_01065 [Saprospiraceae bacterium]|nr:hypothetical protein [Saprospiraceae bacterium]